MCSLRESVPPPTEGVVTVCEQNGELLTRPRDTQLSSGVHETPLQGMKIPNVTKSTETLASLASEDSAQSAFLPHKGDISLWKRAWYTCSEHGVYGMLEEVCEDKSNAYSWGVSAVACGCLATIKVASYIQGSIYPHYLLSREDLIEEFSTVKDWSTSEIRAFSWHPHTSKCAVAWQDNSIKIYTTESEIVPTLKHRHQRGVSCLAWMPLSAGVLAVACQSCTLIWNLDPSSQSTRPSASCAQVLRHNSNTPITTLAWDPRGRLLVSGSPWDTSMMVWDVPRETCVPLGRRGGGGVSLLRWSPDNSRVLAATPSQIFRVWETQHWTCEKWTQLAGRLKAACWSPDGQFLLFCSEKDPAVYSLDFNERGANVESAHAAIKCADLSEVVFDSGENQVCVGGEVQDMTWDPTGERLAILFQQSNNTSNNLIALFNTKLSPALQLIPCGFVQSEVEESPQLIQFQPVCNQGALLAVCYASGKVRFIPLVFMPTQMLMDNRAHPYQIHNGNVNYTNELFST